MKMAKKLLAAVMVLSMVAAFTAIAFAATPSVTFAVGDYADGKATVSVSFVDAVGLTSGSLNFAYPAGAVSKIVKKNGADAKAIGDIDNAFNSEFNASSNPAEFGFYFKNNLWDSAAWKEAAEEIDAEEYVNGENFECAQFVFTADNGTVITVTGDLKVGTSTIAVNKSFTIGSAAAPETTTAKPVVIPETTTVKPVVPETTTVKPVAPETTTAKPVAPETTTSKPVVTPETTTAKPVVTPETTTAKPVVTPETTTVKPVDPETTTAAPAPVIPTTEAKVKFDKYGKRILGYDKNGQAIIGIENGKFVYSNDAAANYVPDETTTEIVIPTTEPNTKFDKYGKRILGYDKNGQAIIGFANGQPIYSKDPAAHKSVIFDTGSNNNGKDFVGGKTNGNQNASGSKGNASGSKGNASGSKSTSAGLRTDGGKSTGDNSVIAIMAGVIALAGAAFVVTKKRR